MYKRIYPCQEPCVFTKSAAEHVLVKGNHVRLAVKNFISIKYVCISMRTIDESHEFSLVKPIDAPMGHGIAVGITINAIIRHVPIPEKYAGIVFVEIHVFTGSRHEKIGEHQLLPVYCNNWSIKVFHVFA